MKYNELRGCELLPSFLWWEGMHYILNGSREIGLLFHYGYGLSPVSAAVLPEGHPLTCYPPSAALVQSVRRICTCQTLPLFSRLVNIGIHSEGPCASVNIL